MPGKTDTPSLRGTLGLLEKNQRHVIEKIDSIAAVGPHADRPGARLSADVGPVDRRAVQVPADLQQLLY